MGKASYHQFCPVAMASEVLCNRWTILVVRELCAGSTRFNDLRRGVPRMSTALLSTRLKELELAGVVERVLLRKSPDLYEYTLTPSGKELEPLVMAMGNWAHRWVKSEPYLQDLDPALLMWDIRRNLKVTGLPTRRLTIQFIYPELSKALRNWWLLIDPNHGVDLCSEDPGFEVDLYSTSDLRTMTEIWMGRVTVTAAIKTKQLTLTGDKSVATRMQDWLGLSVFAKLSQ